MLDMELFPSGQAYHEKKKYIAKVRFQPDSVQRYAVQRLSLIYCIVLYCIVLYCIELNCIVLY